MIISLLSTESIIIIGDDDRWVVLDCWVEDGCEVEVDWWEEFKTSSSSSSSLAYVSQ